MKLKNFIYVVLVISLSLVLVACSGASNSSGSSSETSTSSGSQAGTSLSKVNMLLVGTLKLDGTDQAVTADEAARLLPLWQAYLSLSSSQTAAEAEVEGLVTQIENTMTAEQVQAIQAMNLTSNDMVSLLQTLGPSMGPQGTPDPKVTPDFSQGNFVIQGGGPPEGFSSSGQGGSTGGSRPNPPSGGVIINVGPGGDPGSAAGISGAPVTQGTQDPSAQATAQARFTTQASQVNPMLLQVLINKLQSLTGVGQPTPTP